MRPSKAMLSATAVVIVVAIFLSACGGNAGPTNNPNNTPAPPPSSGSGSGGSGTGGSSGGSGGTGNGGSSAGAVNPATFSAALLGFYPGDANGPDPHKYVGQIKVSSGTVQYTVSGFQPNEVLNGSFCEYPLMNAKQGCTNLNVSIKTDSAGDATGSFPMPSTSPGLTSADSKTFRGWFSFNGPTSGDPTLVSGFSLSFTGGQQYAAAITPVPPVPPLTPQQWGSGSVTVTNATIHIQVAGVPANTTYKVYEGFASEGEIQIGTLVTDGSGNGTVDFSAQRSDGVIVLRRAVQGDDATTSFVVP